MNARLNPIDIERETLHTQLQIAHEELDRARNVSLEQYEHWFNRVKELRYALYGSTIHNTTVSREWGQPDREEEREGASNGAINWEGA